MKKLPAILFCVLFASSIHAACGCRADLRTRNSFVAYLPLGMDNELTEVVLENRNGDAILDGDVVVGRTKQLKQLAELVRAAGGPKQYTTLHASDISVFGNMSTQRRWANDVVPYLIPASFSASLKAEIRASIKDWDNGTILTFREKEPSDTRFIRFTLVNGNVCQWDGATLEIGRGFTDCVRHEIGHALGLNHEHKRSDRDDFITVHRENIVTSSCSQFTKVAANLRCGPYDYASIMHYFPKTFSCNGRPTLTGKNGHQILRKTKVISPGDFAAANAHQSGSGCSR